MEQNIPSNKISQSKLDEDTVKCASCGKPVAQVVIDFCKSHPEWFDNVYCRKCQPNYKKGDE